MLFSGCVGSQMTRIEGTKTYVRIINEVDAERMARFPVNFSQIVGYIQQKTKWIGTYGIEYIQCLIRHPLALWRYNSDCGAYLAIDFVL